ncbi:hypothetical protein [Paenibacillus foliorum]
MPPSYGFCSNSSCEVVYFTDLQTYDKNSLKVPVFQKAGTKRALN